MMKIELNNDIQDRDSRIFMDGYSPEKYMGGIRRFEDMKVDNLRGLIMDGFVDVTDCQNLAPSILDIYAFMVKHPAFKAHGYVVDVKRSDYRLSIEGVCKGSKLTQEEFEDFVTLFRASDEFDVSIGFCWYD